MNALERWHRAPMIRITLQYIWAMAESMDSLMRLDTTKTTDKLTFALDLYGPMTTLGALLESSVYSPTLRSARPLATQLHNLLKEHTSDFEGELHAHAGWQVKRAYEEFRIAFLAELGTFPAYFVSQKGSHDTLTLLDDPLRMFAPDLRDKVPEAIFDVQEAGKALCYETATACGFHLFRATEAVLRKYYNHVTSGAAPPKMRNIMVYVKTMRDKKCGDERILSVVEQLSKLHRNPLIHPEVALTLDEAISILGMTQSVVTAMLSALPVLPKTTTGQAPTAPEPPLPVEPRPKASRKRSS